MYFQKFPLTFYSLDNNKTVDIVRNIFLRAVFTDELKNNYSLYDEYDIIDGETPEIVAHKVYGNSNLHWIILLLNDIVDPRYEWIISQNNLLEYVKSKYGENSVNAIHHYENSSGEIVNGNIIANASTFGNIDQGDVVYNNSNEGVGFVASKLSSSSIVLVVTKGGFVASDVVSDNIGGKNSVALTATQPIPSITPVTNYIYEERQNELRRRIKLLKPQYVQQVINEFESKMAQVNV